MVRIAVLVSGGGTNLQALIDAQSRGELKNGRIAAVLSNRPDVKNAEYSLAQAFYNTAGARSAFYPALSLSGTLGWTNDGGVTTLDPAKWIFNAAASLVQPIFNAGRNQAQLRIAKAQFSLNQRIIKHIGVVFIIYLILK